MSSIGDRLRQERERLNLNQTEFAEAGGTTRKTQFNYETDARRPDADYLAAIAAAGADVLYILTGQRQGGLPPMTMSQSQEPPLAPDEKILLDNYRNSPADAKAAIKSASDAFARPARGAKRDKAA